MLMVLVRVNSKNAQAVLSTREYILLDRIVVLAPIRVYDNGFEGIPSFFCYKNFLYNCFFSLNIFFLSY